MALVFLLHQVRCYSCSSVHLLLLGHLKLLMLHKVLVLYLLLIHIIDVVLTTFEANRSSISLNVWNRRAIVSIALWTILFLLILNRHIIIVIINNTATNTNKASYPSNTSSSTIHAIANLIVLSFPQIHIVRHPFSCVWLPRIQLLLLLNRIQVI